MKAVQQLNDTPQIDGDKSSENLFISLILNDPQCLPDIFKFLSSQDFEDPEYSWIFYSFQETYDGLTMDTAVWLKKMFNFFIKETEGNETEARIRLRGLADESVAQAHPVTLARVIKKDSLRRIMLRAVEAYSSWNVHRGS